MARAIRSDVPIKLGPMLSVRVDIFGAVEPKDSSVHTLCVGEGHEPVRIKQKQSCPTCSAESGFVKGAEVDGKYVIIDDAEPEIDDSIKKQICITSHDKTQVESLTLPGAKVYYLGPNKKAGDDEMYGILKAFIEKTDSEVSLVTVFAIRSRPTLFTMGVFDGAITLSERTWPEDVREIPELKPMAEVSEQYLGLVKQLVPYALFDPSTYVDVTRAARQEALAAAAGGTITPIKKKESSIANNYTTLDLLNASLAAMNAERVAS
jgi:non-homologous end joining protein Ku